MNDENSSNAIPVSLAAASPKPPEDGIGICLSGGGFRAMLFHVGSLWRLNEVGILTAAKRISSVSGGSITAGCLALAWKKYGWSSAAPIPVNEFRDGFVSEICRFAEETIDWKCVLYGMLPDRSAGNRVAEYYDRFLFGGATLQDLPDAPRFVFNASNLQSGALWRFSKEYMEDYKVAYYSKPNLPLSLSVAASSAFPPFLSPVRLELDPSLPLLRPEEKKPRPLFAPPYTTKPVLSDGGVYDNLGQETVFKRFDTVFVSDAGAPFRPQKRVSGFWPLQLFRVTSCIDNQVRSRRKIELMESLTSGQHRGAYWGIGEPVSKYAREPRLAIPRTSYALSGISTRMAALSRETQMKLINWGYVSCAASLDANYSREGPEPAWPFPANLP